MRIRVTRRTGGIAAVTLLAAASAIFQTGPAGAVTTPSYEVVYGGTNNELYTYQTATGVVTDLGFAATPGTNPGVGGGQAAAQRSVLGGDDVYIDPWEPGDTGDGATGVLYSSIGFQANAGTSPSVTNAPVALSGSPAYSQFMNIVAFNNEPIGGTDTYALGLEGNNQGNGVMGPLDTYGAVLAPGTSPSIAEDYFYYWPDIYSSATVTTSELETAFQGTNNDLQETLMGQQDQSGTTLNIGALNDTKVVMTAGTSPALTADNYDVTRSSFAIAVDLSDGHLAIYDDEAETKVEDSAGTLMASGTSPAIASDDSSVNYSSSLNPFGHVEAAFQGSNGDLYTASSPSGASLTDVDTGQPMAPGTNPAITYAGSDYQIAFHGSNGDLWLYNSTTGATDTDQPMATGASPAIGWIGLARDRLTASRRRGQPRRLASAMRTMPLGHGGFAARGQSR
jgi:hypothetical protein